MDRAAKLVHTSPCVVVVVLTPSQGDMKAQYSLGVMHHTGRTPQLSAAQADAAAFKHVKLAAEQVLLFTVPMSSNWFLQQMRALAG